jgi:RHS repeat-associated protein
LTRHQRSAFEPLARGQSPPWRVKGNGSDEVMLQVYPGTRYIDEVVGLRVKDQGRLYAHQAEGDQGGSLKDWNVTALTDLTGRVIEQYWYSPYGQLEAHVAAHPFDLDDDGDVDAQDIAAGTSGGTCWGDYDGASGDCKRLDADGNRDIDVDDYTIVNNYVAARHSEAALQRIPAASHSRRGNLFAHQGLPLDAELASYQNRARQYAPAARRFMQRDPLVQRSIQGSGYRDGSNIYVALGSSPLALKDPSGLFLEGLLDSECCEKAVLNELGDDYNPDNGQPGGGSSGGDSGKVAWSYMHCVVHCVITQSTACGATQMGRNLTSAAAEVGAEIQQDRNCIVSGDAAECESAYQWSDKCDNELGRKLGQPGADCSAACEGAMGGKTRGALPEGPGTIRKFGPHHPTDPGPHWNAAPCPTETDGQPGWPDVDVGDPRLP